MVKITAVKKPKSAGPQPNAKATYSLRSRGPLVVRQKIIPQKTSCMISDQQWEKITKKHPDYKQRVAHNERCSYLAEQWEGAECLRDWKIDRLYGVGTIGTVVGACHRGGTCAAVKISEIDTTEELRSFQNETALQQQAYPYAPKIYQACIFRGEDGKRYSALIMEALSGEADAWLAVRRTDAELDDFFRQVKNNVEGLCRKNMTHGDLVYFNLAYKKTASGRLKFLTIDFDRATNKFCDLTVDLSRLILELYPRPIATPQQKQIDRHNADYLKRLMLQWAGSIPLPQVDALANSRTVEDYWISAYETYCKRAKVKCLE